MAHSPRGWTGARTPSGKKRVRQAERRAAVNGPRITKAKTLVTKTVKIAAGQVEGDANVALAEAYAALDRAAKAGAIHPNAAARRKSRLARKVDAALAGAAVQTGAKATKTTGTAAAAKAAKARIAAGKAAKAKGAQTAAGKARAALAKVGRTDEAAKPAAETAAKDTAVADAPAPKARAPRTEGRGQAGRGRDGGCRSGQEDGRQGLHDEGRGQAGREEGTREEGTREAGRVASGRPPATATTVSDPGLRPGVAAFRRSRQPTAPRRATRVESCRVTCRRAPGTP